MSCEFESFLHNPWAAPNPIEITAITLAKRKERFFEGYDPVEDAQEVVKEHFSDSEQLLENTGLKSRYASLAERIIATDGMIAIFVALAHAPNPLDAFRIYVASDGTEIALEARDIARRVISQHITFRKSTHLCKTLPGFDIAYECLSRRYRKNNLTQSKSTNP